MGTGAAPAATPTVWRRVGATAVDYGLVGAWALTLAGFSVGGGLHRQLSALPPGTGQLLGQVTITVPATVALGVAEAGGGSPGKRLLGLKVQTTAGGRPALGTALVRTAAKVALPWELAHTGVWQFTRGTGGPLAVGTTAAAYAVLGVAAAGLLRGQPWYDRLCGTRVVSD